MGSPSDSEVASTEGTQAIEKKATAEQHRPGPTLARLSHTEERRPGAPAPDPAGPGVTQGLPLSD